MSRQLKQNIRYHPSILPPRVLLLAILLTPCFWARAQDIHFSQFYEAPLLRNPSLSGIFTGDFRVQGIFHDQWNSFANAYHTGSLNAEYKLPVGQGDNYLTPGLQVVYDKAGSAALSTTEFLPALSYHISLSSEHPRFLNLGVMGGIVSKSIDLSKVTTNSQYNGTAYDPALADGEPFLTPSIHYWDGSLGLSFNNSYGENNANNFFIGLALHHLNRPKNSFYKNPSIELDPKYVLSAGLKTMINEVTYITFQADRNQQGSYRETIGGAIASFKLGEDPENSPYTLSGGALIRWKDAIIPVLKLEMNGLAVSLSYDVNTSELKTVSQSRGGFELSLSYIGLLDSDRGKGIPDPKF